MLGDWDLRRFQTATRKGISGMKLSHRFTADSALFDDPNLVSAAGLVPVIALAERAGLGELAQQRLSVPTDKGANAGAKVCARWWAAWSPARTASMTWRCCVTAR